MFVLTDKQRQCKNDIKQADKQIEKWKEHTIIHSYKNTHTHKDTNTYTDTHDAHNDTNTHTDKYINIKVHTHVHK